MQATGENEKCNKKNCYKQYTTYKKVTTRSKIKSNFAKKREKIKKLKCPLKR